MSYKTNSTDNNYVIDKLWRIYKPNDKDKDKKPNDSSNSNQRINQLIAPTGNYN